ncbi:MAG: 50S ribosomal protein L33 [Candidatus Absconditabacteria bacterium]
MAKKGARILTALRCAECGTQNYVTNRNKLNTAKLELKKYCKMDKKHTIHKSKDKLK